MADTRTPPPNAIKPNGKPIPPHQKGQSYNNCGIESMRQLIFRSGAGRPTENELLDYMVNKHINRRTSVTLGLTEPDRLDARHRFDAGGTFPDERAAGLTDWGLPSETVPSSPEAIQNAVESGKGVIVSVWADTLWAEDGKIVKDGAHAIVVIGLIRDEHGQIVSYVINDTGRGTCGLRVPKEHFENSLTNAPLVQTKNPIW